MEAAQGDTFFYILCLDYFVKILFSIARLEDETALSFRLISLTQLIFFRISERKSKK